MAMSTTVLAIVVAAVSGQPATVRERGWRGQRQCQQCNDYERAHVLPGLAAAS